MRRLSRLLLLALAAPWGLGVIVHGADQERYAGAPDDDPGWRNVGRRGATSAIYLGQGWVLTAGHSNLGEVGFGTSTHRPVAGSLVWLDDPGGAKADLILFRIQPEPALPALRLGRRSPAPGASVLMVGYGTRRGEPLEWSGLRGFGARGGGARSWGMSRVAAGQVDVPGPRDTLTRCFRIPFTRHGTHPALAGIGDSGGAVFVRGSGGWRLGGVMLAVSRAAGQPESVALFGNVTNAADLSVYARQILAVTGLPAATR